VPVLTGEGDFPIGEIRAVLDAINYKRFPLVRMGEEVASGHRSPEIAIPHFANWFRSQWEQLPAAHNSGADR